MTSTHDALGYTVQGPSWFWSQLLLWTSDMKPTLNISHGPPPWPGHSPMLVKSGGRHLGPVQTYSLEDPR